MLRSLSQLLDCGRGEVVNQKQQHENMGATKDRIEAAFDELILDISENGTALHRAVKSRMSLTAFYNLIEKDKEKAEKYARATEMRADLIAEKALQISDGEGTDLIILEDGREIVDQRVVQRDRLRVDTRKWLLAKLHPKKYGEKITQDLNVSDERPQLIFKSVSKDG